MVELVVQGRRHALPSQRNNGGFSPSPSPPSSSSSRSSQSLSPRRAESPSRQLQMELEWVMSQVKLQDSEHHKVHLFNRHSHQVDLDTRQIALERAQDAELEYVSERRDEVRHTAESVLFEHIRAEEECRLREEEQKRKRLEEQRRQKEEEERKRREQEEKQRREEAQRRAKLEQEKAEAEARRLAEERSKAEEAEETARQRLEEAERTKAEEARIASERAEREKVAATTNQQNGIIAPSALGSGARPSNVGTTDVEKRHKNYLALHQKLKVFRKEFWETAKANKILKSAAGDMRRALKTSVGQITDDKAGNKQGYDRVKTTILRALKDIPSQAVPVNDFLPAYQQEPEEQPVLVPSLVVYLLSIFSKSIVNAFANQCAVNTHIAEPIGTLVAQIFSMDELQFQRITVQPSSSVSMISIFLAKMHKVIPILFGISGPENTAAGKQRLGWRAEGGEQKTFVRDQTHHDRMTGLSAGYASVALRNFSKAQRTNPYPPIHFWESLSYIVNTNPAEIQTSHLLILKGMLDNDSIKRFITFFGAVAVPALRAALIELPRRLPPTTKQSPAAQRLMMLPDTLRTEKNLTLT